jgi:hypothetical protein
MHDDASPSGIMRKRRQHRQKIGEPVRLVNQA